MPYNSNGDPRLKTPEHKSHAAYFRAHRAEYPNCARCGISIDYDDRTQGSRSLVVGHIIGRDEGLLQGLDVRFVDSLENKQQECRRCSSVSGQQYAQDKHAKPLNQPKHTREW